MTAYRREALALDDRALDEDIDRLRASTEHYIDVLRAWVRRTLADGEHPEDAMVRAAESIDYWLRARGVPFYAPLQETVDRIVGFIVRVRGLMSDRDTIVWFMTPARELRGRTPIEALVSHRFHELEVFIRKLEDVQRHTEGPDAEASGESDDDEHQRGPKPGEPGHQGQPSTDDEDEDGGA